MLSTRWLGIRCTGLRPSTLAGQTLPRTDMPPPAAERRGQAVQRVHDEAMLYLTSIGKRYLGEIELAGYVELSDDTADTIIKFIDEHDIQGMAIGTRSGGSVRSQGASTLRRHKATSLVVYAAASSLISECQRVRKSRRCSVNATWAPPRRRTRKYCRSSSNALQKRDADSKLPKPCIG